MGEFKKIIIGDREYTALRFGPDRYEIPTHLMQRTREDGIIVKDDEILPFHWYGITKDLEGQYLLFDPVKLEPITLISTKYRDKALSLIRKIGLALKISNKNFLDLLTGVLPLYRIYIENGENIVILPPDCGSILTLSRERNEMDKSVRNLIKSECEDSFTLTLELTELMYYAISGVFPYENDEVRESGFKNYKIEYYDKNIDPSLGLFIESTLNMKTKMQRLICGNSGQSKPLEWFLEKTEDLKWNYKERSEADKSFDKTKAEEDLLFVKEGNRKKKIAQRRGFWRRRGALVVTIALIVTVVSYFVGNFLYQKLRAPLTKSLNPREIIEYTINEQNELDASEINEGFKKECAQYQDVLTFFVSSRTRAAYEAVDPFISIDAFLSNEATITSQSFIYGAIIKEIKDNGNNSYTAILDWYTPQAINDEDELNNPSKDGSIRTFHYTIEEDFTFQWNKRGWWECVESKLKNPNYVETIYSPYSK